MGLKDKVENKVKGQSSNIGLSPKEASFVISKLRQTSYQGTEFETFYEVMKKLQMILDK
jgi:hypothetical protein|tara:strand:- start:1501 stop:1677 length:177 start_codon:yes stop_codon:yes gene_type:complete